jgi:hypothetical protein
MEVMGTELEVANKTSPEAGDITKELLKSSTKRQKSITQFN